MARNRILPCPDGQAGCPWCGGPPSFQESYYEGTGASGMEAPTLSIGCALDKFWFPFIPTDKFETGKGYTSLRKQAEADLLEIWGMRA